MEPDPLIEALQIVREGRHLSRSLSERAVAAMIAEGSDLDLVAEFLKAARPLDPTAQELAGAAQAVRHCMVPFAVPNSLRPILDTCGTGGDGANSVNISTAAAIVVAACGVRVAKHGNRASSGNSGSAEVLSELGVRFDAPPVVLLRCLEEVGITFLFAPNFHPALRRVASVRKQLPHRTIFNLIGPLVNPARPDRQIVGVPSRHLAHLVSTVLKESIEEHDDSQRSELEDRRPGWDFSIAEGEPSRAYRAFVVSGANGLDEVTLSGATHVFRVQGGGHDEASWTPPDFGLDLVPDHELTVSGPTESASRILAMLEGARGPVRDVVLANVAAALLLVGKVRTLQEGVITGAEAIDRGDAKSLLTRWVEISSASS